MIICIVATKDYNFYNFRRDFIISLVKKGNDVFLICPYGSKIDYFTNKGCNFIDIKIDRRGKNPFNELSIYRSYLRIFKKTRPHLVLTYTTKCSIYAGMACSRLKIPYIVNNAGLVKDGLITNFILCFLYKKAFKKASSIMCQNFEEKIYFQKILGNKLIFKDIPGSGVDLKEFKLTDYPPESNDVIFNYVGRISKLKGIDEFISCAIAIKKDYPQARFVIYGEYDDDRYKSVLGELIEKNIVEYGGVLLDMKPAIDKAHAVIHSSHYEGMTNVVLEHSAMGRPCIGSNISGIKEAIDDGVTGFLFECKNVKQLIEVTRKFIRLPYNQKVEMGLKARLKMEQEFNREIVSNIYWAEIDRIAKNNEK